jgi:hypothetical protein
MNERPQGNFDPELKMLIVRTILLFAAIASIIWLVWF